MESLQKKQHEQINNKAEYFTLKDKKASAMLSLLYGSAEQASKEIKLMNDSAYRHKNFSELYLQRAHTLPSPLIFFPESIPEVYYPIDDKIFRTYRGYVERNLPFSKTTYMNGKFLKELENKSREQNLKIEDLMEFGVNLSFAVAQREFSEVYHLPKIINSELDAISEFDGYGELLNNILIESVNMDEEPTKTAIYKKLLPYVKGVLTQIHSSVAEKADFRKFENTTLLKFILICNVLQSIIITNPAVTRTRT